VFFIQVLKQNRYTAGTDYAPPPKGYILTNIALNAQPFKNKPVTIYFSMDNVLNVKYRNYLNRFRYFTDESGRLTTIGINLNF
jgi:iron complex outermembrane receptor protein